MCNYDNHIKYIFNGEKYVDKISYLPNVDRSINPLLDELIQVLYMKTRIMNSLQKKELGK